MLKAIALLLTLQLAGELLVRNLGLPLPGALAGMLLLLCWLIYQQQVSAELRQTSQFLLQNLMLLFIPFIVGIVAQLDRMAQEWLPFVAACIGGAALSLLATAWTLRWMLRRQAGTDSLSAADRKASS